MGNDTTAKEEENDTTDKEEENNTTDKEEEHDDTDKKLVDVTNVEQDHLFDFYFEGSIDNNNRFEGQGKLSFLPVTVFLRGQSYTPSVVNVTATFVAGEAEGVATI